MLVAQLKKARV